MTDERTVAALLAELSAASAAKDVSTAVAVAVEIGRRLGAGEINDRTAPTDADRPPTPEPRGGGAPGHAVRRPKRVDGLTDSA